MGNEDIDLLKITRGSVTAPAGCGKTQLIVEALKSTNLENPILVLTHTNAGVTALKARLKRNQVPSKNYRLATIDGWTLQIVSMFPMRSAILPECLELLNPSCDYPALRGAAEKLLREQHIKSIIETNYSHLIVDEYQDCSKSQHEIIVHLSTMLPTCVLGDPLQAIFGFKGNVLVDWMKDVQTYFKPAGELSIPWRWINVGAEELGRWLLRCRDDLLNSRPLNFSNIPKEVTLIKLTGSDHEKIITAASKKSSNESDNTLLIGNSMNPQSRYDIARSVFGATTVEPVDFKDLISFADKYNQSSPLISILELAKNLMTGIGNLNLETRIQTLLKGKEKNPASALETFALHFIKNPTYQGSVDFLELLKSQPSIRVFRPEIYYACIKGFQIVISDQDITLKEAMIRVREQNKFSGRNISKRAIGSTLLLKGLESEHCVILDADSLDYKNLYVAMTRGSKTLTICSSKLF